MNYAPKIAELFGFKINEEFMKKGYPGLRYRFSEWDALQVKTVDQTIWSDASINDYKRILTGKDKVMRPPFEPEFQQIYYYVTSDGNIMKNCWEDSTFDFMCLALGNCFRTEADGEIYRPEIFEKLRGLKWDGER